MYVFLIHVHSFNILLYCVYNSSIILIQYKYFYYKTTIYFYFMYTVFFTSNTIYIWQQWIFTGCYQFVYERHNSWMPSKPQEPVCQNGQRYTLLKQYKLIYKKLYFLKEYKEWGGKRHSLQSLCRNIKQTWVIILSVCGFCYTFNVAFQQNQRDIIFYFNISITFSTLLSNLNV